MQMEDNLRSGMTLDEARRQAVIKLGGTESTKELYREQQGIPGLDGHHLWRDRFGSDPQIIGRRFPAMRDETGRSSEMLRIVGFCRQDSGSAPRAAPRLIF